MKRSRARLPAAEAVPYFARLLGVAPADDGVATLEPEAFRRGLHEAFASWLSAVAAERDLILALEDVHWADASSLELTASSPRVEHARSSSPDGEARGRGDARAGAGGRTRFDSNPWTRPGSQSWSSTPSKGPSQRTRAVGRRAHDRETPSSSGSFSARCGSARSSRPPRAVGRRPDGRRASCRRRWRGSSRRASISSRGRRRRSADRIRDRRDGPRPAPRARCATISTGRIETLVARLPRPLRRRGRDAGVPPRLVHDVAYSRLLRRQRRDLHRRVADVAEALYGAGDDVVELLARHLYLGEAGAKAFDYLVRAGERALHLYANEEAIVHFTRAEELVEGEPAESGRRFNLLSLADLHDLVGDYDESVRLYRGRLRDATSDGPRLVRSRRTHRKRGEYEEARAVVDEGFAPNRSPESTSPRSGSSRVRRCPPPGTSRARSTSSTSVCRSPPPAASRLPESCLRASLVPRLMCGRSDEALRHALDAQAGFETKGDQRALSGALRLLGDVYTTLGRPEEAVETLERGLELAERVGNVEELGGCLINLGLAKLAQRDYDAAVVCNERAIAEFERIGHGSGRALGYSNLAWVLANKGDYDDAERYCALAIEVAEAIGHRLVVAETTDTMAFIGLRRGTPGEAAARAEEAARLFLELGASPKAAQSLELAAKAWDAAKEVGRARETRSRARALV